jgi:dTDP-4-dehydrorhamnose reductase
MGGRILQTKRDKKFIAPAYHTDLNLPAKRTRFSTMTNEKITEQLAITTME